ncbi:hypothetical protein CMK14_19615 [Candidatus Poribacteria bacterium]|nr:hypothetical protein [Candidatus Poribacteria bacterium]
MSLSCKQVQRCLSDYNDNLLTEDRRTMVACHLGGCNFCRYALESLVKIQGLLQYYHSPPLPNQGRVFTDLQQRIENRPADFLWWRRLGRVFSFEWKLLSPLTRYSSGLLIFLFAMAIFKIFLTNSTSNLTVSGSTLNQGSGTLVLSDPPDNSRSLFAFDLSTEDNQRFDRLIFATSQAAQQQLGDLAITSQVSDSPAVFVKQPEGVRPLGGKDSDRINFLKVGDEVSLLDGNEDLMTVTTAKSTVEPESIGANTSALFAFSYSAPPQSRLARINRLPEVFREMVVPLKQDPIRDTNLSLNGL